jgi:hypothetical protein
MKHDRPPCRIPSLFGNRLKLYAVVSYLNRDQAWPDVLDTRF